MKDLFSISLDEIDQRMKRLTRKEIQSLEMLCNGHTYKTAGAELGITDASFTNRISIAVMRAEVETRSQLIALFSIWKWSQRSNTEYQVINQNDPPLS